MVVPMTTSEEAACSFDALFQAHYRHLARLLYRVSGDMAQAEELASEAFWRLYRKPPPVKTNLEGWLYRTGIRLALDQLKMERRRRRYEALASLFGRVITVATPEQAQERSEECRHVRQAFHALPLEQVTLLLLRSEGLSYAEIAATLQLHLASVGTLLARAQHAFRKEYMRLYGTPE